MKSEVYWISLQLALGFGASLSKALGEFGSPQAVLKAGEREWRACSYLSEQQIVRLRTIEPSRAQKIIEECDRNSWSIITPDSELYPQQLMELTDFPCAIYVDGDSSLLTTRLVAVSGTRSMSDAGLEDVRRTVAEVYENSASVVSGAARGCDCAALESSLACGAGVAVTAWGLGCAPDKQTHDLLAKTSQNGAVITCYEPHRAASLSSFQTRNRLMAAICQALIAVEAGEKGGTLKMAASFERLERPVYAVPGSAGCDRLLRAGAHVWRGVLDGGEPVYTKKASEPAQPPKSNKTEINLDNLSQNAIIVYNILKTRQGVLDIDSVITESGLTPTQAACSLTELEIMGAAVSEVCGYRAAGL